MTDAPADARAPHRVILVREWDEQHTGSGCCGRLSGLSEIGDSDTFTRNRHRMDEMGAVYRALRRTFAPEVVDIQMTDPRNTAWLVPAVWRDARRRGADLRTAGRTVHRATAPAAIICDGTVLFAGEVPTPAEAVDAVLAELGRTAP